MAKILTGKALLSKHVTRRDRVLLVNPPVEETRYSWLRWNQPLDLLKLGSFLRSRVGCSIELIDCMKPDSAGHVREEWLPRDRRYYSVKGHRYPMRRFGEPHSVVKAWLDAKRRQPRAKLPTQVWITSLCSFWRESVAEMCRVVRQAIPDAQIVLLGQYPHLMPEHASENCAADCVVSQPVDLQDQPSALDLYGTQPPPFAAVQLHPATAIADIHAAVQKGILDVAFFVEDVCRDDGQPLAEAVEKTQDLHKHLRYHIICGLSPAAVTPPIARVLANRRIAEIHFEEADAGNSLDLDAYLATVAYLREAGMRLPSDRLSGFVWIGRPGDQLDQLVLRAFQVLDSFGSLILKPFTPTPGSAEHEQHKEYLKDLPDREWSPHFFPFSELNSISRDEYHDLYRMAAFLNEKVRDRAFDFLKGTLGVQMLRDSLRREVWNLEPSPLRVID